VGKIFTAHFSQHFPQNTMDLEGNDDPFADGDDDFGAAGGDAGVFNEGGDDEALFAGDNGGDDPFADVDGGVTDAAGDYDMIGGVGGGGDVGDAQNAQGSDLLGMPMPDAAEQKISSTGVPGVPVAGVAASSEDEDCSALMAWKSQWRVELEGKAAEAAQKKEERRAQAQGELKSMADARQKALDARAETNRQDEMAFLENNETLAQPGSNPWERVVSLIDVQVDDLERAKATERMRSILIQMKGASAGPGIN
jgi:hypothetical protein